MMRFLSVLAFALPFTLSAQFLDQTYGGPSNDRLEDILFTADGNLLAVGRYTTPDDDPSPWFLKTNTAGDVVFNQAFETVGLQTVMAVVELSDGSFVAVGLHQDGGFQPSYGLVMRVSSEGSLMWTQNLGTPEGQRLDDVILLDDGTLMALGTTESGPGFEDDFWLVQLNDAGDVLNSWTYGSAADEGGIDIVATPDGFVLSGSGTNPETESVDSIIITVDADMTQTNQVWYGTEGLDYPRDMLLTSDNEVVVVGYADPGNDGVVDGFFMQAQLDGLPELYLTFESDLANHIEEIVALPTGGFFTAGVHSTESNGWDMEVLQLDDLGQVEEVTTFGGEGFDYALGIAASDTQLFMCGINDSNEIGAQEGWLIGLDMPVGIENHEANHFSAFPNPCFSHVQLAGQSKDSPVRVYDQTGRLVLSLPIGVSRIDCSNWSCGVYHIHIDGKYQKLIVQR